MSLTLKTCYAPSPAITRGKPLHLGNDPKNGKNILYCTGNGVVIRNLTNPIESELYMEHSYQTTVARYSPTGFYIASADVSGRVRIWDTINKEHILKIELQIISGPIYDLQWSDDSKRIVAVGEGREKYAVAFMWDTGSSVGDLSGHGKAIQSCDIRQVRPYRVATGSEDFTVNWFEGPPFKFNKTIKDHTRFVNCVRFSPDGNKLITVGSDKCGFFYDGKTGEKVGELSSSNGHGGGIYSVAWSKDSKQVLSASADKTAKLWNADNGECVTTFHVSDNPQTDHQLLSALWQGDNLITVGLNSDIYFHDPANPKAPKKVIKGHNKSVGCVAYDFSSSTLFTGDFTARIIGWNMNNADTFEFDGKGHSNKIFRLLVQGDKLISSAMDDSIRITSIKDRQYSGDCVSFDSSPEDIAIGKKDKSLILVVLRDSIVIIRNGKIASKTAASYEPSAVALSVDETQIAVGGKDKNIHLYSLSGDKLTEGPVLQGHRGPLTTLEYSPNGHLASADANRDIFVWDVAKKELLVKGWQFHNARVNRVTWAPDGVHLASASLDGCLFIWDSKNPEKRISVKDAHKGGVNDVIFIGDNSIVSVGQDCAMKLWTIVYH